MTSHGGACTGVSVQCDSAYNSERVMEDWRSSYVLGNDTERGWGLRYFFTFYSEPASRSTAAHLEVVLLLVTFVFSVVANLSIAAAVLRYREMRTVTNCFLLNLAVADLLFATGIPLVALARVLPRWQLGDLTCRLLPYSQVLTTFYCLLLFILQLLSFVSFFYCNYYLQLSH